MNLLEGFWTTRNLREDLLGGLTTAIISLPMALAFGVASGMGAEAGLYGAVLVGFWAALFGGTNTLISEPTGPMTLMMATVMTSLASHYPDQAVAMGFAVVVMAGLFQVVFGLLKLGRYITLMPYSVISGFMSGIGLLLIVLQIGPMLGHANPPGGAAGVIRALPEFLRNVDGPELALGLASMAILFWVPGSWGRRLPPALLALVVGTLAGTLVIGSEELRTIGEIPMGLPSLRLPVLTADLAGQMMVDALLLALLGCIDTMLTAMIADSLTRTHHESNRELVGQGIANTISGFFGGLPGAGATMGTVVNIQCGARTRRAGLFRALVLLLVILAAAPLLEAIPTVILAAVTMKVGFDILDWSFLRRAHRVSRSATIIMYGVMIITVLVDVMVAVGVGVFIANIITIDRLSRLQSSRVKTAIDPASEEAVFMSEEERELFKQGDGKIVIFHLSGPMIFGVAKAIAREHRVVEGARVLIVDLSDVPMLSTTIGLAMENVIRDALATGCRVIVSGAAPGISERLESLDLIGPDGEAEARPTRLDALQQAVTYLDAG